MPIALKPPPRAWFALHNEQAVAEMRRTLRRMNTVATSGPLIGARAKRAPLACPPPIRKRRRRKA